MKRLILFLLISALSLSAMACGPGEAYAPDGLYIFRMANPQNTTMHTQNVHANIIAWQSLIGQQCPDSDIYTVVYKSSITDMQHIRNRHSVPRTLKSNRFAQVLCSRDELSDFLITAKQCEKAREAMIDPWYYPSHHCPHVAVLEKIVCTAKAHDTDTLLHDRYALQQMRAQSTLGRHQDNVKLWEQYASQLPEGNILRTMMAGYATGAYQHIGQDSLARQIIFNETGYYDNPDLWVRMESELRKADYQGIPQADREIKRMRNIFLAHRETALSAVRHPKTQHLAEWYYALAYIDDVLCNDVSSEQYLRMAEKAGGDTFIRESIHLFRIYRDAKSKPVNESYEQQMYANLHWLEQRLVRDFPQWQQDGQESPRVLYKENFIIANYSTYYWNDMLRRIGLSIYAPRLMEAGRTMRALEVINYAENCLFCATGNSYMQDNHFGYLFQALDIRKAKFTLQYINHLQQHRDTFSHFLARHSYIDFDWLYNIAGTLCMRESHFAEASAVLAHLPQKYTGDSIHNDPFRIDYCDRTASPSYTTRRALAVEMVRLEKQMKSAYNINDRADAQIRYAIALRNMFSVAWEAVAFGMGFPHYIDSYTPNTHKSYIRPALQRSDALLSQALQMYTDPERAAKAELALMNFRTVVTKYPNTAAADSVRSACENYYDFGLQFAQTTRHITRWDRHIFYDNE